MPIRSGYNRRLEALLGRLDAILRRIYMAPWARWFIRRKLWLALRKRR